MMKFIATVLRELRQLSRDRAGLIMLFVMPAALVLIITLVQDNVFRNTGTPNLRGLVVDQDGGAVTREMIRHLEADPAVTIQRALHGAPVDEAGARKAVGDGDYQFCVIFPKGLSASVETKIRAEVRWMLSEPGAAKPTVTGLATVNLYFDPLLGGGYRMAINGWLNQAIAATQARFRGQFLGDALNRRLAALMGQFAGSGAAAPPVTLPKLKLQSTDASFLPVVQRSAAKGGFGRLPTAVQQNVPAWALFGMFFIVVPLAGSLIRERRDGILARLTTMPVSPATLLAGKMAAYVGVSLVQFAVIVVEGKWLLPMLGTEALTMGNDAIAVILVVVCSALAAVGFGVLLGTMARTSEQVTTVGPLAVVIAAAMGGIMVPVFAMPRIMRTVSQLSPLAWAHGAFMQIFVRGGTVSSVLGDMGLLVAFFAVTMGISLMLRRRELS